MSVTDIFWSFPSGLKDMIFDNLDDDEKFHICYETQKYHELCEGYINVDTLMDAIEKGDINRVKLLLKYDIDINYQDEEKGTPLFVAVRKNNEEIVKYLLDKGANANLTHGQLTPLMIAKPNISKLLIEYGADINIGDDFNRAIDRAILMFQVKKVEILLDAGANIQDYTILPFIITEPRYYDMIKILLKYGANPNEENTMTRETLLDSALNKLNETPELSKTIELLRNYGAK